MLRGNMTLVLAGVALLLAVAQMIHPFGFRVHPGLLVIVAALLVLRHLMRRTKQNRDQMVKSVPPHPLGLSDDDHRTSE
jgi:hypothetical protein